MNSNVLIEVKNSVGFSETDKVGNLGIMHIRLACGGSRVKSSGRSTSENSNYTDNYIFIAYSGRHHFNINYTSFFLLMLITVDNYHV